MPPRKQTGEGIVLLVDVGPLTRLGLPIEKTFFNQSKTCLINILQRKLFAEKCRDHVGIVLFGTDGTDNMLASGDQYQHITVLQEPRLVDWGSISAAESLPRGSHSADWLDAIVVAMDLLHDPQGTSYTLKKIVLLTDFSSQFSDDQTTAIIKGITAQHIDFSVIGPELSTDGDDDTDGAANGGGGGCGGNGGSGGGGMSWSGKPKSVVQMAGEALISNIVSAVDGIVCSFDEAIPHLVFFEKKTQGSNPWNTVMDIGDFRIPVTGYIKMKRATINSWSRCHATDEAAVIIKERSYHKQDDQQTPVEDDDIIDGYRYGTTLVPFSEDDRTQMQYSSGAESSQLSVLGFTRSENCSLPSRAGEQVLMITAKKDDQEAAVALSSVIQAMFELDMVGISRRVCRKGGKPVMGALYPHITPQSECLVWIGLPYQEDVRPLRFPSLQRHTNALTEQQTDAFDGLIDAMNLCPTNDEDEVEELMEPSSVLNPQLQHFYTCLADRAMNPGRPLPPPQDHVLGVLSVPAELRESMKEAAGRLVKLFPTTRVVKRIKRNRENLFQEKDADGNPRKRSRDGGSDDDEGEVSMVTSFGGRVTRVSTTTPTQDFTAMIQQQPHNFMSICSELVEVLLQLVETIAGGAATDAVTADKIVTAVMAYRGESITIDPRSFNKFLRSLRDMAVGRGIISSLWAAVRLKGAGLITSQDTLKSEVTVQQATDFLELSDVPKKEEKREEKPPPPPVNNDDDYDDLLDDL